MGTLAAGDPVHDFTLKDLTGAERSSLESRWQGLLLYAIYKRGCGTCRFTIPFLQRFHEEYAGPGLQIWGVAQDSAEETAEFAAANGLTFPILIDADLDVTYAHGLVTVPGIYLVDSSDRILRNALAFVADELNAMAQIVAERTGKPYRPIVRPEDDAPAIKPG